MVEFIDRYREINVAVQLSDDSLNSRDLIEGGFDLAVRLSPASESSMIICRVGALQWIVCASPTYLSERGMPLVPEDLTAHNCLIHLKSAPDGAWRFMAHGKEHTIRVSGCLSMNGAPGLRIAALRGLGIALLPAYCIVDDLREHRLVTVLPNYAAPDRPMYVVYPNQRQLPARVRIFIDFMVERFGQKGWETPCP